jgi:hypothetical protein
MATEADLNKLAGIVTAKIKPCTAAEWRDFKAYVLAPFTAREKRVRDGLHIIQKLAVGQRVSWQARKGWKPHVGHVVAVVAPLKHPARMGFPTLGRRGYWRDHESYVVEAEGQLWWPRVGSLKKESDGQ